MLEDETAAVDEKDDESAVEQTAETETISNWRRVVDARVADWDELPHQVARSLMADFSAANGIRDFLWGHVGVFTSPTSDPAKRRKSFEKLKLFFARIDQARQDAAASDAMIESSAAAQVDIDPDATGAAERSARELESGSQQAANIDGATSKNVDAAMVDNNSGRRCNNTAPDPAVPLAQQTAPSERTQHEGEATGNNHGGNQQTTRVHYDVILGPAYKDYRSRGRTILEETLKKCTAKFLKCHTTEAKIIFAKKVYSRLLDCGVRFRIQESPSSERLVVLDEKRIIELLVKGLLARAQGQQKHQPLPAQTRALAVSAPQQQMAPVRLVSRSDIRERDVLEGRKGHSSQGNHYYSQQYRFYRNQGYDKSCCFKMAMEDVRKAGGRVFVAADASGELWREVSASDKLREFIHEKRGNSTRLLTDRTTGSVPDQAYAQPSGMRPAVAALTQRPEDAVVHQLFRCNNSDVLLGKFEFSRSWPGNKLYAEFLIKYARKYPTCRPGQQTERKVLIARRAMNAILSTGGRFLKHCQNRTGPETLVEEAWLKVDLKYVEQLTCQLIPDAREQVIDQGKTDASRYEPSPTLVQGTIDQPRLTTGAPASLSGGGGSSTSRNVIQQIPPTEMVDLTDDHDPDYSSENAGLVPAERNIEMEDSIDAEIADLFQETSDDLSTADQAASIQDESEILGSTFMYAISDRQPTHACTQDERPLTKVALPPSPELPPEFAEQVSHRLKEWDPFWEIVSIVGIGVTCKVQSTSPETQLIKTAANFTLSLTDMQRKPFSLSWGKKRGKSERQDGDVALILRMLPVDKDLYEGKRADCHLWPKGTFLQINGEKVWIVQRKQQLHDHSEWKSLCCDLDVVEYIQEPEQMNNFQFFCFDEKPYVFVLSFCRYRSAKQLQLHVTAPSSEAIPVLPQESCFEKALNFAGQQVMVTIDDDSGGEADSNQVVRKLLVSLLCPISKALMNTPVRGKHCKHFQCFDLETYIFSNEPVSGSRWRCAACENFVSLQNLEVCELTRNLLHEFASSSVASADRHRVELCPANRSHRLLPARQPKKRARETAPAVQQEEERDGVGDEKDKWQRASLTGSSGRI